MNGIAAALAEAHVLVVTGSGGVGKTTTAAALGLDAARAGRRTLVVTIDPARRLAQALGLEALGDAPERVALDDADTGGSGELWAMMLDMQTTFDRLVARHASSPEAAASITSNRIYRTLSSTLSGTQEYMAMERLHELHDDGDWDLIVVDTPPTRTALDFLDAPRRMTSFLEGRLLRLLLAPGLAAGRGIGRLVGVGTGAFLRVAGRVTGMELLDDLAEFFRGFEGMYEGFKRRAEQVLALLSDPSSRFVVVASPEPPPLAEARFLLDRLEQEGLAIAGVVVNRIRPSISDDPSEAALDAAVAALSAGDADDRAAGAALALLGDVRRIAARQRRDVVAALHGLDLATVVEVPLLGGDVHDLAGLEDIAERLVGTGRARDGRGRR
jgi:anion-transporting  ArsA/GET3 family ATPase